MTSDPFQTSQPPIRLRGQAGLLLGAGAACGFGVGAFFLTLTLPDPAIDLRMPELSFRNHTAPGERLSGEPRVWPAAFGTAPPPVQPPQPAPEPEPEAEPTPPLTARLRGLAVDDDGGWALIEIDGQLTLVRPGSQLDQHHGVGEIQPGGVLVFGPDGMDLLTFDEMDPADRPATTSVRESLARSYLRGEQDLFDMPTPLPPGGYVGGPGFLGPID
jgi:hypothetical protein